jgi:hypothetical protein
MTRRSPALHRPMTRATMPPLPSDTLASRVRGEYLEMPRLRLTQPQAARLLGLETAACSALLERLTAEGFLRRGGRGQYVLCTEG